MQTFSKAAYEGGELDSLDGSTLCVHIKGDKLLTASETMDINIQTTQFVGCKTLLVRRKTFTTLADSAKVRD